MLTATAANPTYTENGAGAFLFSGAAASTIEAGQGITQLVFTVSGLHDGANERIIIDGSQFSLIDGTSGTTVGNGLTASISVSDGTATVTLEAGSGPSSTVMAAAPSIDPATLAGIVNSLRYLDTGNNPTGGPRTVTLTAISDNGGTANGGADTTTLSLGSTVTVAPIDDPAVANDDSYALGEGGVASLTVLVNDNDVDGPPLAISSINGQAVSVGQYVALGSGARVRLNADGTLSYDQQNAFAYLVSAATAASTGAVDSSASDSFTYTLAGGGTATVTLGITGADGPRSELRGDATDNVITGTAGADIIRGGAGNDTLIGGAGTNILFGDGGTDTASYATAGAGVAVTLALHTAQDTIGAGIDTFVGIERLTGSAFDDVLTGSDTNNLLSGGNGNDVLEGGGGDDTLVGGGGTDIASYASATTAVTVDLGIHVRQNTGAGFDALSAMEGVLGSSHDDTLTGNSSINRIDGGLGAVHVDRRWRIGPVPVHHYARWQQHRHDHRFRDRRLSAARPCRVRWPGHGRARRAVVPDRRRGDYGERAHSVRFGNRSAAVRSRRFGHDLFGRPSSPRSAPAFI